MDDIVEFGISNYRGSLCVKREDEKAFWCVSCDLDSSDEWNWEEIPEYLYDAIMKFHAIK